MRPNHEVTEIPLGGRNLLHTGDPVRVLPSVPGRHDGFVGRVKRIRVYPAAGETPEIVEVDVIGRVKDDRPVVERTFTPARLERVYSATIPDHERRDAP